jgi:hypothetical protein
MQNYKLYFLDRNDVVITVRDFGGIDDAAALTEGEKFRRGHAISICCGDRQVAHLDRQTPPKGQASL